MDSRFQEDEGKLEKEELEAEVEDLQDQEEEAV